MNCFNPEDYDDDIIVVEMRSLGRGRGFEKTAEYSALGDDELTGRISKRLKRLLKVIEGETKDAEKGLLEDMVEELEDEAHSLKAELERGRKRIGELEAQTDESESLNELLSHINEVLSDTTNEDYRDLESAVAALIEAYDDLQEETEDYD